MIENSRNLPSGGQINEIFEGYKYNSKNLELNEGIVAYITALQNLAQTCNFGTLHDSLLGDRIVFSVLRKHTRQKLLHRME